eukprot:2484545-Amphidinium_carterae.1
MRSGLQLTRYSSCLMTAASYYEHATRQWLPWSSRTRRWQVITLRLSGHKSAECEIRASIWLGRRRLSSNALDTYSEKAGGNLWSWGWTAQPLNLRSGQLPSSLLGTRWLLSKMVLSPSATTGKSSCLRTRMLSCLPCERVWGSTHVVPKAAWSVHSQLVCWNAASFQAGLEIAEASWQISFGRKEHVARVAGSLRDLSSLPSIWSWNSSALFATLPSLMQARLGFFKMAAERYDICAALETHCTPSLVDGLLMHRHRLLDSVSETNPSATGGIIIAVKNSYLN